MMKILFVAGVIQHLNRTTKVLITWQTKLVMILHEDSPSSITTHLGGSELFQNLGKIECLERISLACT